MSVVSDLSCLLLVLYIHTVKCYLDKILNSNEATSVVVLYPT